MTTIKRLEVHNMKRIRIVEINAADQSLVTIAGRNAQGKSSLLDGIFYALAGGRAQPSDPVRHGEERAEVVLTTDDGIQIRRTWSKDGKTKLSVETADGDVKRSPQRWLDDRIGALSFDPLAFIRLDGKKQAEMFRRVIGVDTTDLDNRRSDVYAMRTDAGRNVRTLAGQLDGLPHHEGAALVDTDALLGELDKIRSAEAERDGLRDRAERADESMELRLDRATSLRDQAEAMLREADSETKDAEDWASRRDAAKKAADKITVEDEGPIREQLSRASDENRKVRDNEARARVAGDLEQAKSRVNDLTKTIDGIDEAKREAMKSATIPVDGLEFGESGILFLGVPLDQASSAEQLRVSMALGLALNPEIRVVLIREGSLLDEESVEAVAKMAEDAGAQVWLEVVGGGPEGSIVIEDGEIAGEGS